MHNKGRFPTVFFGASQRPRGAALAIVLILLFVSVAVQPLRGQTYKVLYTFNAGSEGMWSYGGLTMDQVGNLYGTAVGYNDCGTVFRLADSGPSGWVFTKLYGFGRGMDSCAPMARPIFGPDNALYGTTAGGGAGPGYRSYGTVFKLKPGVIAPAGWRETQLHAFYRPGDGIEPHAEVVFDQAGNLYGTTGLGGGHECPGSGTCGTVYKLTPSSGGWTETVLYAFTGPDGAVPAAGLLFDNAGNLYGTTRAGGDNGFGTVFQLTPSGSGWTEKVLYNFQWPGDSGADPYGTLISDGFGNLYGTTVMGGANGGGTVFELSPSEGGWTFTVLYSFVAQSAGGPRAGLTMDGTGSLYGTTFDDGLYGMGSVFKLTHSPSGWTYTSLHDFSGSEGECPQSNVVIDVHGNLYGTTTSGGTYDHGGIWEITP